MSITDFAASELRKAEAAKTNGNGHAPAEQPKPAQKAAPLRLVRMSDVKAETVEWLWKPYIPKSKLTMFSGQEDLGKGWLSCALASAVSNGNGFPPNFEPTPAGNVLMMSIEDGLSDTLKPRLQAVGANCGRVFVINEPLNFDERGLLRFEQYIAEVEPALITIDPIFAHVPSKTDINSANQSRAVSSRLIEIAAKWNAAIILIRHIGKAKGNGDTRAAGLGSVDWRAAVRSELIIGKNPNNEVERIIAHDKSNLSEKGDSIGFTIENTPDGAQFRWTGKSDVAAWQLVERKTEDERADANHAVGFLREALKDGRREAGEVKREAFQNGLTEQNLRTARNKLNVEYSNEGFGKEKKWFWSLPLVVDDKTCLVASTNSNQQLSKNCDYKHNEHSNLLLVVDDSKNQQLRGHLVVDSQVNQQVNSEPLESTTYRDNLPLLVSENISNNKGEPESDEKRCLTCEALIASYSEKCPNCDDYPSPF